MPAREDLIAALTTMPDEAFGWIVLACLPPTPRIGHARIWPDALGGFSASSQAAIDRVRRAASACLDEGWRAEPPAATAAALIDRDKKT